jgi:hypothetical protein
LNGEIIELSLNDSIYVQWNIYDEDPEDNEKTVAIHNNHLPLDMYNYMHAEDYIIIPV